MRAGGVPACRATCVREAPVITERTSRAGCARGAWSRPRSMSEPGRSYGGGAGVPRWPRSCLGCQTFPGRSRRRTRPDRVPGTREAQRRRHRRDRARARRLVLVPGRHDLTTPRFRSSDGGGGNVRDAAPYRGRRRSGAVRDTLAHPRFRSRRQDHRSRGMGHAAVALGGPGTGRTMAVVPRGARAIPPTSARLSGSRTRAQGLSCDSSMGGLGPGITGVACLFSAA